MGIISIEQSDRLYWLGRYTERVYTTLRIFSKSFDIAKMDLVIQSL
ncbi:alpha-E domain-containing protein [Clostridium sp. SM-530-WT-3G]|nr:alpha-E domain-containing protein [Clostridium sp. SM-530-WT-3G]